MTRYPSPPPRTRAAQVASFSPDRVEMTDQPMRGAGCVVRVTHASVGSTDVAARRGDYVLHPFPGFVTGYDLVGVIEQLGRDGHARGLSVGDRVAAVLPRMGAHATRVRVPASLLVPVPDGLASESAATLPLDAVTARHALDMTGPQSSSVFLSGVSGAVGLLAAQLALREGTRVFGSASARSAEVASAYGVVTVDYREDGWWSRFRDERGPVDAVIDHTGAPGLASIVRPGGRIVRTAFGGPIGRQRTSAVRGLSHALVRRYARPSQVVCSTPMYVATRRSAYRRDLADLLGLAASGALDPPAPEVVGLERLADALAAAAHPDPGRKVVLAF